MSDVDIDTIEDEELLHKMMGEVEDFEKRKKIRARMKVLREAQSGSDQIALNTQKKLEEEKKKKEMDEESTFRATKTEEGTDGSMITTTTTSTTHKTKAQKGGAMNAFKQMDAATAPPGGAGKPNFAVGGGGGAKAGGLARNPSAIKQMLLQWCQQMTKEYDNVNITNFSSSWNDGMAFCALVHHFFPRSFDYAKLDPKKRRGNFTLAFNAAEKLGNVPQLLDVEDMVRMKNPDWKCVFTYVQQFYRMFRNNEQNKDKPQEQPPTPPTPTPETGVEVDE